MRSAISPVSIEIELRSRGAIGCANHFVHLVVGDTEARRAWNKEGPAVVLRFVTRHFGVVEVIMNSDRLITNQIASAVAGSIVSALMLSACGGGSGGSSAPAR